jgi:hypothetical protein
LKCLSMLMGTVVLRDSFPDVATERVVSSPIYFTSLLVNGMVVVFKFTYYTTIKFTRLFTTW